MFDNDVLDGIITESSDNGILDAPISEADQEFVDKCPSMNPEQHWDPANSGDHWINVPGGLKEAPNAKPEGGEFGPWPNGMSEKPTAKPAGGEYGPTGGSETMDASAYNDALTQMQKSFKEGYDLLNVLKKVRVVDETLEQKQQKFVEEALFAAYDDGPLFEAVERSDKTAIKAITKEIRKDVQSSLNSKGVQAKPYTAVNQVLHASLLGGVGKSTMVNSLAQYSWQILGIAKMGNGKAQEIIKALNKEFSEKLGDYKILGVHFQNILSAKVDTADPESKNGVDNVQTWMLIVDKKIPEGLQSAANAKPQEKKEEK